MTSLRQHDTIQRSIDAEQFDWSDWNSRMDQTLAQLERWNEAEAELNRQHLADLRELRTSLHNMGASQ